MALQKYLELGWTPPSNILVSQYRVTYRYNNENWFEALYVNQNTIKIPIYAPGTYDFKICTITNFGFVSLPLEGSYIVNDVNILPKILITGLELFEQGNDTVFEGKDAKFTWRSNSTTSASDFGSEVYGASDGGTDPLLKDYQVTIFGLNSQLSTRVEYTEQSVYTYSLEKNFEDVGGPRREFRIEVSARDLYNNISPASYLEVSNPAPVIPEDLQVIAGNGSFYVQFSPPSDLDYKGVLIYYSKSPFIAGDIDNIDVYNAANPNNPIQFTDELGNINTFIVPIEAYTNYYVRIRLYDDFGKTQLNTSPQFLVAANSKSDFIAPNTPANLSVTSESSIASDGTNIIKLIATWDANLEGDLAYYDFQLKENDTNYVSFIVATNRFEALIKPNTVYDIKVAAVDSSANKSSYTERVQITSTKDAATPSSPSGLSATSSFKSVFLTWVNPTENDLKQIEIYESNTNNRGAAILIGSVSSNSFTRSGLDSNATKYYWIRAIDTSGNASVYFPVSSTAGVQVITGTVSSTDINAFAISASKQFSNTIVLENDIWGDDLTNGIVSWNNHKLFYQGKEYQIAAGSTSNKYIYWTGVDLINAGPISSSYVTSASNPTLGDSEFIIATNVNGAHDLAWNSIANEVIGSAYIQNAAITSAKIQDLAVDNAKIANATIDSAKMLSLDIQKIRLGNTSYDYTLIGGKIYVQTDVRAYYTDAATVILAASNSSPTTFERTIMGTPSFDGFYTVIDVNSLIGIPTVGIIYISGNSWLSAGSTDITPGKIVISGPTKLSDWRQGGDLTKIAGGFISTNTVRANVLEIGNRGISIDGVQFEVPYPASIISGNIITWTSGTISHVNEDGISTGVFINSGNFQHPLDGNAYYITYTKYSNLLNPYSNANTAFDTNNVPLATYRGGVDFIANYGRTIIDGSKITTNTLEANTLKAGTVLSKEFIVGGGLNGILRSDNWSSGEFGWRVLGDGSAEFNNVDVRGSVNVRNLYAGPATNSEDSSFGFRAWGEEGISGNKPGRIWAGSRYFDDAPFAVDESGNFRARNIDTKSLVAGVPEGTVTMWAGDPLAIPDRWFICDGRILLRPAFPGDNQQPFYRLFSGIGTTYNLGSEGATGFRIPSFEARLPLSVNDGTYSLNQKFGTGFLTITTSNLPPHSHGIGRQWEGDGGRYSDGSYFGPANGNDIQTSSVGGGVPLNVFPPVIGMYFMIYAGN